MTHYLSNSEKEIKPKKKIFYLKLIKFVEVTKGIKNKYMTNVQTWLNKNIINSERTRTLIREIHILANDDLENNPDTQATSSSSSQYFYLPANELVGKLDLSTFPKLEKLVIEKQSITSLVLTNCCRLKKIDASYNLLENVVWPNQARRLQNICLTNNNFSAQDLSCFANFTNLKTLFLGTENQERIRQNIYNRWNGSLTRISNLDRLQELDINATDINDGLIDLPTDELFHFTFGNCGRIGAGVDEFKRISEVLEFEEDEDMEAWAYSGTFFNYDDVDGGFNKVEDVRKWQHWQRQNSEYEAQVEVPSND